MEYHLGTERKKIKLKCNLEQDKKGLKNGMIDKLREEAKLLLFLNVYIYKQRV